MERCLICKARLKANTPICPRCGTDLSKPLSIEKEAKTFFYQAVKLLGEGHLSDAIRAVEHSLDLKSDPLALTVRAFIQHKKTLDMQESLN